MAVPIRTMKLFLIRARVSEKANHDIYAGGKVKSVMLVMPYVEFGTRRKSKKNKNFIQKLSRFYPQRETSKR